jgi:hypothetical protein
MENHFKNLTLDVIIMTLKTNFKKKFEKEKGKKKLPNQNLSKKYDKKISAIFLKI